MVFFGIFFVLFLNKLFFNFFLDLESFFLEFYVKIIIYKDFWRLINR